MGCKSGKPEEGAQSESTGTAQANNSAGSPKKRKNLDAPFERTKIEQGDMVYWPKKEMFDLIVEKVKKGHTGQVLTLKPVTGDAIEDVSEKDVVKLRGPQLHIEDLRRGAELEFKCQSPADKPIERGVLQSRTSSEVCLKLPDTYGRHSQQWVSREDIYVLYVIVFNGRKLKNMDMGFKNKSDPYVKVNLNNPDSNAPQQALRTSTINDNLDPDWNQDFRFLYCQSVESLTFEVWDEDVHFGTKSDDLLGQAVLKKDQWEGAGFCDKLPLTDQHGGSIKGGEDSTIRVHVKIFEPQEGGGLVEEIAQKGDPICKCT